MVLTFSHNPNDKYKRGNYKLIKYIWHSCH